MNTENLSTQLLDTREAMLETLHMAYQYSLDTGCLSTGRERSHRSWGMTKKRLSTARQKELGRRLAEYWLTKSSKENAVALALATESGQRMGAYLSAQQAARESDAASTALSMTAESDARMNTYTATQRAALEAEGRAMTAQDTTTTP